MKRSVENLNIALVHEWITNVAGAEKVLLALKELFPKAPIYTAVYDKNKAKPFEDFEIHTSFLQNIPFMKSKRELLVPFTPFAFEQFDLSKYDLAISSTTIAAKGVITKPETLHISYCHTPPRYLWDPQVDPRAKKGRLSWLRNKTMHDMRIWDRVAADRVDHYLANSHYIAKRIKKFYGKDSTVIYPPVDLESFKLNKNVTRKDHFLFVSRLIDYKKCDLVIEAFNSLQIPLRIVGYGPDEARLIKLGKDNITFAGPKFGADLAKEYQEAKALVFAAEEDFGIVPIEAMACGCPVIAYGKGGTTESVIDGKTGIFFKEQTKDSVISAVKKFDEIKFDEKSIREQSERFSKEKFKSSFMKEVEKYIS